MCGRQWCLEKGSSCTPHHHIPADAPFPGPLRKHQLTHLPQVQCPEKKGVQGELSPASPLLLVRLGVNEEGGLPQPPIVRVRAATSELMSQQAFSQILSLFSFLLHEMGIINEKQRGAGRGRGGTLVLACQTCAPTPSWNPIPFLVYSPDKCLQHLATPPLLSPLPSLKRGS